MMPEIYSEDGDQQRIQFGVKGGDEPYYPVNDEKNGALYQEYKKLAHKEQKVIFGGRLGEYKYYDMDAVIASALELAEKELD